MEKSPEYLLVWQRLLESNFSGISHGDQFRMFLSFYSFAGGASGKLALGEKVGKFLFCNIYQFSWCANFYRGLQVYWGPMLLQGSQKSSSYTYLMLCFTQLLHFICHLFESLYLRLEKPIHCSWSWFSKFKEIQIFRSNWNSL